MADLVERDHDVRTLFELVTGGGGALVTGEAGVGKTALTRAVIDTLESDRRPVVRAFGLASRRDLPLAALSLALSTELGDIGGLPGLAFERALPVAQLPTVVLVDDVDQLDALSIDALSHVIEHRRAVVVMTQRSHTTTPAAIAAAVARRDVTRLSVSALSPAGSAALCAARLGRRLTAESARRVHDLTGGNPLYVTELILAAEDSHRIAPAIDELEIREVPANHARLRDVVVDRIDRLAPEALTALQRIAAIAPASTAELLPHAAPGTVDELESRGLVRVDSSGRRLSIRPAHPIQGEVLAAMAPALVTRRYRAEAADTLGELGARRRDDRLRMAAWALDGGRAVPAADLAAAANIAFQAGDRALASRMSLAAFDAEPTLEHALLADKCLQEMPDLDAVTELHRRWATEVDHPDAATELEVAATTVGFWRRGDDRRLVDLCEHLRDEDADIDPAHRRALTACASCFLAVQGDVTGALELAEPLSELPPGRDQLFVAVALGNGRRSAGRPMAALEALAKSDELFAPLGHQFMSVSENVVAGVRAQALAEAGLFSEHGRFMERSVAIAREFGTSKDIGIAHLSESWADLLQGRTQRAIDASQKAARLLELVNQPGLTRWALSVEALAQASGGTVARARGLLDLLDASAHPARLPAANIERARGWLAFRVHGRDAAAEVFTATIESALSSGIVSSALLTACDLARIGHADAASAFVGNDALDLDGVLFPAIRRSVSARVDGTHEALDEAAEQFATIGCPHLAAELFEEAGTVAPVDSAARRRTARVAELRALTDWRPLPAMLPTVSDVLTKRESEVARLAATGVTSKEIAEQLFIATRTVDTHLQRVYQKLGIRSRTELAGAMSPSTR